MQPVVADVQVQRAPRAAGARRPLEHAVASAAPEDERGGASTTSDRNVARVDLRLDDGRRDQLGAEPRGEPVAQLRAPRLELLGEEPALGLPARPLLRRAGAVDRPRHLAVQARIVVGHAEEVATGAPRDRLQRHAEHLRSRAPERRLQRARRGRPFGLAERRDRNGIGGGEVERSHLRAVVQTDRDGQRRVPHLVALERQAQVRSQVACRRPGPRPRRPGAHGVQESTGPLPGEMAVGIAQAA